MHADRQPRRRRLVSACCRATPRCCPSSCNHQRAAAVPGACSCRRRRCESAAPWHRGIEASHARRGLAGAEAIPANRSASNARHSKPSMGPGLEQGCAALRVREEKQRELDRGRPDRPGERPSRYCAQFSYPALPQTLIHRASQLIPSKWPATTTAEFFRIPRLPARPHASPPGRAFLRQKE